MSKWTKEQIDEFWRQPHGHVVLGAVFADRLRLAEEEFLEARAHADRLAGGPDASRAAEYEAETRAATKRQHAALGTMFRSDPSVPPGYVLPRDREAEMRAALPRVEGYEECDDDSLILTCETDPDCGVAHRVVMPGMFVRRILGTRRADITARASQLADKCGALRTENTALLVENARLRRRIEDMERKGKR